MIRVAEHRTYAVGLADLLLYDAMVDDGVLLLQDGALLAGWSFRGPDMASATHAEMAVLSARLNSVLRLGSGWMVQCDAIRSAAPHYPDGTFPDPTTAAIDEERRRQFQAEGAHFESEYFLAVTYLPPSVAEEKVKGFLFEGGSARRKAHAEKALEYFQSRIATFEDVLSTLFRVERLRAESPAGGSMRELGLTRDALLRYVHRCITGLDHPFLLPDIPIYLHEHLGSADLVGGMEPKIGNRYIRIVAVDGFPKTSFPGMLGALDALPMEYRWNSRAILLDPEEARALLDKTRKKWRSGVRGWKDQLLRTQSGAVNLHAQEMADDAERAMSVASAGDVYFAIYSSNILCLGPDIERLDENVALVVKTVQNLGFAARVESVNSLEAWRGSLPGDGYRNVRRVILHTLNLADILPIASVWAGERENPSPLMPPHSPPLLYAATAGATPFRLNLHVSDLGHSLVIGPPGAGKSTLLGLLVSQWFRYPGAQVFAFDKGYSLYVLNRAAGGEFYDIAGEKTNLAFTPLRDLDTPGDLAWAVDWLEMLCVQQGAEIGPRERNALGSALVLLRESPTRTMTELVSNVQDLSIRDALQFYTLGGPMGTLLDAEEDALGNGRFLTFECESLMNLGEKSVSAVLLYLFRQIEKRLDGSPTLVVLDEAWVYLRNDLFRERVREWLKTLRKLNATVIMATQQLSDIFHSPIRDVVLESCPTKILLPNAEASNPESRKFYESIGLNDREIGIVQTSLPKRHYYAVSPLGRRLINLGLGGVALAFVGVNGREERRRAEETMRQCDADGGRWQAEWLRSRGLGQWADYFEVLASKLSRRSENGHDV